MSLLCNLQGRASFTELSRANQDRGRQRKSLPDCPKFAPAFCRPPTGASHLPQSRIRDELTSLMWPEIYINPKNSDVSNVRVERGLVLTDVVQGESEKPSERRSHTMHLLRKGRTGRQLRPSVRHILAEPCSLAVGRRTSRAGISGHTGKSSVYLP